jgi:hypothetical protein
LGSRLHKQRGQLIEPIFGHANTTAASASLACEPIVEDGRIVGMVCPDCLTVREQCRIRVEQARVIRRLKRGLPLS